MKLLSLACVLFMIIISPHPATEIETVTLNNIMFNGVMGLPKFIHIQHENLWGFNQILYDHYLPNNTNLNGNITMCL